MRVPSWLIVTAAAILALPFGWGLGVLAAYLIAGKDFGQLPMLTVPIALVASVIFALAPLMSPLKRLAITAGGALAFMVFGALTS